MIVTNGVVKARNSHIFERHPTDCYVEPEWCARRLFAVEQFHGLIWDPACGTGSVLRAARAAHHCSYGSDISEDAIGTVQDFLTATPPANKFSIVTNPPFDLLPKFAKHALELGPLKVAMICRTAGVHAAHKWLKQLPCAHMWFMTPRPSMPSVSLILRGEKPSGDTRDFS